MQPPAFVLIVAGGQGLRMGSVLPKQFLPLAGKPILFYAIKAFVEALPGAAMTLVLPEDQINRAQMILSYFDGRLNLTIAPGGATRFHSVQRGLVGVPDEAVVMVHDGVRPLVSAALIQACYQQAVALGSAVPAVSVTDSIRMLASDGSVPIDRQSLRAVQTPQTFRASILLPAMRQPYQASFTDEATVVEAFGQSVQLIEGDRRNLKITTPEDLVIATALLQSTNDPL